MVNLTTYETFYEEKRPFFLEGKRIFTLGLPGSAIAGDESGTLQGDQLFYSRRIGAPPVIQPLVRGRRVPRDSRRDVDHQRRESDRQDEGRPVGGPAAERDRQRARQRLVQWRRVARARGADDELRGRTRAEGLGQRQLNPWRDVHVHSSVAARRRCRCTGCRPTPSLGQWTPRTSSGIAPTSSRARRCSAASPVMHPPSMRCRPIPCTSISGRTPRTSASIHRRRPCSDMPGPFASRATARASGCGRSRYAGCRPGLELNDVGYLRQADVILNEASLEFKEIEPRGVFRSYGFSVTRDDLWDFGGLKTTGSTASSRQRRVPEPVDRLGGSELPRGPDRYASAARWSGDDYERRVAAVALVNSDPSRRLNVQASMEREFVLDGDGRRGNVTDAGQHPAGKRVLSLGHRVLRTQRRRSAVRAIRPIPQDRRDTCWAGSIRTRSV